MHQVSLHIKSFNNKIKVLNQTNSKELVLSAIEARNLQAEIFELLAQIADLTKVKEEVENTVTSIQLDGGAF